MISREKIYSAALILVLAVSSYMLVSSDRKIAKLQAENLSYFIQKSDCYKILRGNKKWKN